jgi:hypothetical protein
MADRLASINGSQPDRQRVSRETVLRGTASRI